ncbi:hypothetical protein [Kordia sp.]|uniref:hypothetical protein n=1 Tax=Kordia sp. TaxID=1965332 RepID=UPI003B5A343B
MKKQELKALSLNKISISSFASSRIVGGEPTTNNTNITCEIPSLCGSFDLCDATINSKNTICATRPPACGAK